MTFTFKEIVHPEIEMLFIHIDCFAASCWVFKDIIPVKVSAFSQIKLN